MKIVINVEDFEPCDSNGECLNKCPFSKGTDGELVCNLRYISNEEGVSCLVLDERAKKWEQKVSQLYDNCTSFNEVYKGISNLISED